MIRNRFLHCPVYARVRKSKVVLTLRSKLDPNFRQERLIMRIPDLHSVRRLHSKIDVSKKVRTDAITPAKRRTFFLLLCAFALLACPAMTKAQDHTHKFLHNDFTNSHCWAVTSSTRSAPAMVIKNPGTIAAGKSPGLSLPW